MQGCELHDLRAHTLFSWCNLVCGVTHVYCVSETPTHYNCIVRTPSVAREWRTSTVLDGVIPHPKHYSERHCAVLFTLHPHLVA
jgi:hypothetical protein